MVTPGIRELTDAHCWFRFRTMRLRFLFRNALKFLRTSYFDFEISVKDYKKFYPTRKRAVGSEIMDRRNIFATDLCQAMEFSYDMYIAFMKQYMKVLKDEDPLNFFKMFDLISNLKKFVDNVKSSFYEIYRRMPKSYFKSEEGSHMRWLYSAIQNEFIKIEKKIYEFNH